MTLYEQIISSTDNEWIKSLSVEEMAEHTIRHYCRSCDCLTCHNCLTKESEIKKLNSEVK